MTEQPPGPVPAPVLRRCYAGLIDFAVISVVFYLFLTTAQGDDPSHGNVLMSTLWFAMLNAYYFLPELFWNGQTLGKRLLGLRVVASTGARAGALAVLIRTLLRPVDFFPILYGFGLLIIWVTGPDRRARLGDLAGSTRVVEVVRS